CLWRLLHEVTLVSLSASLACCGLLLMAKLTGVVLVPLAVVLVGARLWRGTPWAWRLGVSRWVRTRRAQATLAGALALLHVIVAWGMVWAHYEFRYAASPQPADASIGFRKIPAV